MIRRVAILLGVLALVLGVAAAPRLLISRPANNPDFVHFECSQVHPAAMTPDGTRLLVVNTPDNRLTVFDLTQALPQRVAEIPVGLEPVSVAARNDGEAWVVNNLSDDVSVVDLTTLHVKATLRVGDEPNDVVFAGPDGDAYVSVSQEDAIKVYDASTLAQVTTIPVGGRMPRALAKNASGSLVFAAVFDGGNRTTVIQAAEVQDSVPDDPDFPRDTGNKHGHDAAPVVGQIVQYFNLGSSGAGFYDEYGKFWGSKAPFTMPDVDVAEINTTTNAVSRDFSGTGSVNYNLAVAPDGRLAVAGTEARNQLRFEPKLRGYVVDTRISYVSTGGAVTLRLLNPHINYSVVPGTQSEVDSALGIPSGLAFSPDGQRLFVASFANDKLAVLNPAAGANQVLARVPTVAGPTTVVPDAARGVCYVVGRFHNELATVSMDSLVTLGVTRIGFDPTPDPIVNGRKFFYGGFTSGHGDQACASCHVFGDMDNLAWDLGNPFGEYVDAPPGDTLGLVGFDPQKGPMTTQSLRGMLDTEPFHWRGDRENLAAFNPAFVGLMGRAAPLPDSEMTAFSDFVMPLAYPPNPQRNLDNTLPDPNDRPSPAAGEQIYLNTPIVASGNACVTCHATPPGTNRTMVSRNTLGISQDMKVPQLRNLYKKTGFTDAVGAASMRGFGYGHDGGIDNLFHLLQSPRFLFDPDSALGNPARRALAAFLLAYPTGTHPAVGVQVTFDGTPNPDGVARVDTLRGLVVAGEIDLIAKGRIGVQPRGWLYLGGDAWQPDKPSEADITTQDLLALAGDAGSAVTVTGVPLGSGQRMGIDRDRDTFLDGEELDAGSDPGDPQSTPLSVGVENGDARLRTALERVSPNPAHANVDIRFALARAGRVDVTVFDVLGREVRALARSDFRPGRWSLVWDGRRNDGGVAGAGVYFVRLHSGASHSTRTLVRLR